MNLLKNINQSNNFTKDLPDNIWTQNFLKKDIKKFKKYNSIEEAIISNYDIDCIDASLFDIDSKKLDLATHIDEDVNYNKFNYSKKMSKKIIQQGLFKCNVLSSLIYLSDLYKINLIIYYKDDYYQISVKNYSNNLIVKFQNNKWYLNESTINNLNKNIIN